MTMTAMAQTIADGKGEGPKKESRAFIRPPIERGTEEITTAHIISVANTTHGPHTILVANAAGTWENCAVPDFGVHGARIGH